MSGTAGSFSGTKDQNFRMSSVICLPVTRTGAVVCGQGAPMRTQSVRVAISSSVSLAALGHLQGAGLVDGGQQEALFRIAGDDSGAGVAAFEGGSASCHVEAALGAPS